MADSYPLREQKKQRTHAQLIEAADRVFLIRGFNNATMEEIAAEAGMHVQTLYRHFPSKKDIAVGINRSYFEAFEKAFLERQTKTLPFWRSWVNDRMRDATINGDETFRENMRARFTLQETPLSFLEVNSSYESLLATGFAADLKTSLETDKRPMLIACLLWGGNRQNLRSWALSNDKIDLTKEAMLVIDAAVQLLNLHELLE